MAIVILSAFMSGYTYNNENNSKIFTVNSKVKPQKNSVLQKFYDCQNDSAHLVFCFTYACQHCLNSIDNIKEYENFGVADKVIGSAFGGSATEKRFEKIF